MADIADCYSQINHHRVKNALEIAGVASESAEVLEHLLSSWGSFNRADYRVGPTASIFLADACLNDVDDHLLGQGWQHTRYVDDFRISAARARKPIGASPSPRSSLYGHRLAVTFLDQKNRIRPETAKQLAFAERKLLPLDKVAIDALKKT